MLNKKENLIKRVMLVFKLQRKHLIVEIIKKLKGFKNLTHKKIEKFSKL